MTWYLLSEREPPEGMLAVWVWSRDRSEKLMYLVRYDRSSDQPFLSMTGEIDPKRVVAWFEVHDPTAVLDA